MIGDMKKASEINFSLVFGEEGGQSLSEHPFDVEVSWLTQFSPETAWPPTGFYLLEGDEACPTRIWHGNDNDINALFKCIWEEEEDG